MIIVKLAGGLGNQMFQYATALALAIKNNTNLKIDLTTFYLDKYRKYELGYFKVSAPTIYPYPKVIYRIAKKLLTNNINSKMPFFPPYGHHVLRERSFSFNPIILEKSTNVFLDGYWQSEKYFSNIKHHLQKEYLLKYPLNGKLNSLEKEIRENNSVSLHIRRGDYISNPKNRDIYIVCSTEYYRNAIEYISSRIKNPKYYVFSNDMNWAKENLSKINNITFVETYGAHAYEELYLMSLCKHNIIANSTFSWWGAWLNTNSHKIVISPKKWFKDDNIDQKDLIPSSWNKI